MYKEKIKDICNNTVKKIYKLLDINIDTVKDKFNFKCHMCGNCCKKETSFIIHPFEAFNILNYLDNKEDINNFRDLWIKQALDIDSKLIETFGEEELNNYFIDMDKLFLFYKDNYKDTGCLFYKDDKCTIYEVRPLACRLYGFSVDMESKVFFCKEDCSLRLDYDKTIKVDEGIYNFLGFVDSRKVYLDFYNFFNNFILDSNNELMEAFRRDISWGFPMSLSKRLLWADKYFLL